MAANPDTREPLLCFTGMPGSGKSTVASLMMEKGFRVIEMSDAVKALMTEKGIPITSDSLRSFSTEIREKHGYNIVSRIIAERVRGAGAKVVVSGVRSLKEVEYLKANLPEKRVVLVALVLSQEERFRRIKAEDRKRSDETPTREALMKREEIENSWGLKDAVVNADAVLSNKGTKEELSKDIDRLLATLTILP